MNAYRNYNNNTSSLSGNLEKLSSGYKINRAGDDAAGLAISEKMRAQISGLEQAQSNVKDGISLVKTGEGAMQEVQDMLNRMVTLATQSANGTYDNDVDRANLQKEVTALQSEINRIADSANFNGIKLLDGSLESGGGAAGQSIDLATALSVTNARAADVSEVTGAFYLDLDGYKITATATNSTAILSYATTDKVLSITIGDATLSMVVTTAISQTGGTVDITGSGLALATADATLTINGISYSVTYSGTKLTFEAKAAPTSTSQLLSAADRKATINPNTTPTNGSAAATSSATYNNQIQNIKEARIAEPTKQAQAKLTLSKDMLQDGAKIKIGDETYAIDYSKDYTPGATDATIGVKQLLNAKGELDTTAIPTVAAAITAAASGNTMFTVGQSGNDLTLVSLTADSTDLTTEAKVREQVSVTGAASTGEALKLQIGDTSDSYNQLKVSIKDIHASSLEIDDVDISSQDGASTAIDKIKKAINTVSSTRGDLGAVQNRLEHTANNLSVMAENIQDAESTIRDTDIAEEMMSYTKNSILVQSAQAMLAQANTVPQGVLQLLQ
jgi:flagellin